MDILFAYPVLYFCVEEQPLKIQKIRFAYFTPVMLTRKIVYNIAHGMSQGIPSEQYNLTAVAEREREHHYAADELLIAALPTFGGRVPVLEPPLLRNLHGNGTPAVVVVTYGGRGYEDTLAEAQDILREQGFVVFAGGAFCTMHSVAPKLGEGRPNAEDLELARGFGRQLREKLDAVETVEEIASFPGDRPYKPAPPPSGLTPTTNDKCVLCMQCHRWCPVDAIPYNNPNGTTAAKCILCHGCVIRCPVNARTVEDEGFQQKIAGMTEAFADKHPVSEVFI